MKTRRWLNSQLFLDTKSGCDRSIPPTLPVVADHRRLACHDVNPLLLFVNQARRLTKLTLRPRAESSSQVAERLGLPMRWHLVSSPPQASNTCSTDRKSTRLNSSHLGISYA